MRFASIERVKELDYVLTPGRYVGLPDEEDDFDFKERFAALKAEFEAQLLEEAALNKAIAENFVHRTYEWFFLSLNLFMDSFRYVGITVTAMPIGK